jgi:bifunctional DNase/RNase
MSERAGKAAGWAAVAELAAIAGILLAAGPKTVARLLEFVHPPAEVVVQEVVHGRSGHDALVFREKDGERRIIVPISAGESRTLTRMLRSGAPAAARTAGREAPSEAGKRILRASIDAVSRERVFSAHLTVYRELGPVDVESPLADAVALALERGAPIWMARDVLDRNGVTPEDARSLTNSPRARSRALAPGSELVTDI